MNYFYIRNTKNAEVIKGLHRDMMVWQSEEEAVAFIERLPADHSSWEVARCPLENRPDQEDK